MESSGLTNIDDDRCEFLRWKGMYIQTIVDPVVGHSNDRAFWCLATNHCIGPDDKLVDDYECNETRSCYKAL